MTKGFLRLKRVSLLVLAWALVVSMAEAQVIKVNWKDKEVVKEIAGIERVFMNGLQFGDPRLGLDVSEVEGLKFVEDSSEADALLSIVPAVAEDSTGRFVVTAIGVVGNPTVATVTVTPITPSPADGVVLVLTLQRIRTTVGGMSLGKIVYLGDFRSSGAAINEVESLIKKAKKRLTKLSK